MVVDDRLHERMVIIIIRSQGGGGGISPGGLKKPHTQNLTMLDYF